MDKYQHYEDASCGLLSGLQACEATASRHLSEPVAVDPKNLQRQLEEMKVKKRGKRQIQPQGSPVECPPLSPTFVIVPPRAGEEGMGRCVSPSGGSYNLTSVRFSFFYCGLAGLTLLSWFVFPSSSSPDKDQSCLGHLVIFTNTKLFFVFYIGV